MKKIILIVLKLCGFTLIASVMLFFVRPSAMLDFYIFPEGIEFSNEKEIFFTIKPFFYPIRLTHTQRHKSHLSWSPQKNSFAFYENIFESYDKEWALKIINPRTFRIRTIFIGTLHASNYEWRDDQTVRVYVSQGTGVRRYRDISIFVEEPFVDIDHDIEKFWVGQYNAKYREGGEDWRED